MRSLQSALVGGVATAVVLVGLTGGAAAASTSASTPTQAQAAQVQTAAVHTTVLTAAPSDAFVTALYTDYLGRTPSAGEVSYWSGMLSAGAPRTIVTDGFVNSDEYRKIRITEAYQTVLGRGVDPSGAVTWLDYMHAGVITTDDIEKSLYGSEEFYNDAAARYHSEPNPGPFTDDLYASILKREVNGLEGLDWLNREFAHEFQVNNFTFDRGWMIDQIYGSPEAARARVSTMYQLYLGRTPDEGGTETWAAIDLSIGDSATRSGLTSSDEYFSRAQTRF